MHTRRGLATVIALVVSTASLVGLVATALPAPAAADDPILINWPSLLPSWTDAYVPNSENDCVAGRPNCVDITIREMQRRFDGLAQSCDHNAVFSLAYLRTTQTYKWARDQQGFFDDTPWVNHEDAVFGRYYFDAYDNWAAGNRAAVPKAWLIAFDAAKNKSVNGNGDLLLGMSAHVNRDLAYVLAAISITTPDGTSRKPDHDKVNEFLNVVTQPLLAELAGRFDPVVFNVPTPFGVGYTAFFQLIESWRETAWRNAEALTNASSDAVRSQVAQSIEDYAASTSAAIAASQAYLPPLTTSASRDAYCGLHKGDAAPMSYAFGTASAW